MNSWQITKKDLRLLVRDRRTLFVLIVLPMAFIAILGFSTGQLFSEREKARQVKIGLLNEDQTPLADQLIAEANKLAALSIIEMTSRDDSEKELAEGKVDVLVVIGPHYHERVADLKIGDIFYIEEGRLAGKLKSL